MSASSNPTFVDAASAVLVDERMLLLVRRANEPGKGLWSLPGGACHEAEQASTCALRELWEETGVVATVIGSIGTAEIPRSGGPSYRIVSFLVAPVLTPVVPRAAGDALEAGLFCRCDLLGLDLSRGLIGWLDDLGMLALID